jgi:serine/threonine protein phosphatase PrpC
MLTSTAAILHDNTAHGEDNYLVRHLHDHCTLDAVMDGVTGRGGREASQEVVNELSAAIPTSPEAIVSVLETINQRFYQISLGHFLLTTVSVALCLDNQLHVVSVGDSPAWLIRSDTMQLLSSDTRGLVHIGISRALGMQKTLRQLRRSDVEVVPGDRLVLATDGVTDNMTQDELADIVRCAASPDEAIEQIRALIAARRAKGVWPKQLGGRFRNDDLTAILRFFSEVV